VIEKPKIVPKAKENAAPNTKLGISCFRFKCELIRLKAKNNGFVGQYLAAEFPHLSS